MRILVFGAGAMGSLFGSRLSIRNHVTLVGRREHVRAIREKGLVVRGETKGVFYIDAIENVEEYEGYPDLILIAVKSYDTEDAVREIVRRFGKEIYVVSLQNGLDNLDKMKKHLGEDRIILALTTEACTFSRPGEVLHTGRGKTILGSLTEIDMVEKLREELNLVGFEAEISKDIIRDMWRKAMINACINPLTALLEVENGRLKNPVLFEIVRRVCRECVDVAVAKGLDIEYDDMLKEVEEVIDATSRNLSSMLQSLMRGRKTEIDSINGYICKVGGEYGIRTEMNDLLVKLIRMKEARR